MYYFIYFLLKDNFEDHFIANVDYIFHVLWGLLSGIGFGDLKS